MLPRILNLSRIDKGQGVKAAMIANKAKWHHSCMLRYNNTMVHRAEKRKCPSSADDIDHTNTAYCSLQVLRQSQPAYYVRNQQVLMSSLNNAD